MRAEIQKSFDNALSGSSSLLRRVRMFLELRQSDIEHATGIPVGRLSAAERGKLALTRLEQILLKDFLEARLCVVLEVERDIAARRSQRARSGR